MFLISLTQKQPFVLLILTKAVTNPKAKKKASIEQKVCELHLELQLQ
jgi:hypothetical protein